MDTTYAIENHSSGEITCLMIPLTGNIILLPSVSVAEMIPYQKPAPQTETPDWFVGRVRWRDVEVPVVSLELLNGETMDNPTSHSRIAILNNTGVDDSLPFIGIQTTGIPRLARIGPEEIQEETDRQKKPFDQMIVNVTGESAIIPDITAMERAFLDM